MFVYFALFLHTLLSLLTLSGDDAAQLLALIADDSYGGSTSFLPMALPESSVNSSSFLPGLDTSIEDLDASVIPVDRLSGALCHMMACKA